MLTDAVPPLKIPISVVVAALPLMTQFLMVLLVAPSVAVALASQITAEDVPVFVLAIVKLRSVPPLVEPSIVTRSAPLSLMRPEVEEPEIVRCAPVGIIVTVKLLPVGSSLSVLRAFAPVSLVGSPVI